MTTTFVTSLVSFVKAFVTPATVTETVTNIVITLGVKSVEYAEDAIAAKVTRDVERSILTSDEWAKYIGKDTDAQIEEARVAYLVGLAHGYKLKKGKKSLTDEQALTELFKA